MAATRSAPKHVLELKGHEVRYHFDPIANALGAKPTANLMRAWEKAFSFANGRSTYTLFQSFRTYILQVVDLARAGNAPRCRALVWRLAKDKLGEIEGAVWRAAMEEVVRALPVGPDDERSQKARARRAAYIHNINSVLGAFVVADEAVDYRPLRGPRVGAGGSERVPTLGELVRPGFQPSSSDRARSVDQLIEEALVSSRDRLQELRNCLIAEFRAEAAAFELGRYWLEHSDAPRVDEIEAFLSALGMGIRDVEVAKMAIRARFGPVFGTALCLAVLLVSQKYGGVLHSRKVRDAEWRLVSAAGGSLEVVRHLEATPIATNAASALIMTDAPWNLSSVSDLPADPYVGGVDRGRRRIATVSARKSRQNGEKVFGLIDGGEADLKIASPNGNSTVSVIDQYILMSDPIRARAASSGSLAQAKALFVFTRAGSNHRKIKSDLAEFSSEVWPAFRNRHMDNQLIGGLPITRRMLRPTIMQLEGSKAGNDVVVPRAMAGQNRVGTTEHYLDAAWLRAKYEEHIAWFQDLYEAALLDDVLVPSGFAVPPDELSKRRELARQHGFSFWCDRRGLSASELRIAVRRPTCTPLDPCESCPIKRFRPTDIAFTSLHLADEALRRAEERMITANPARWYEIWMPWYAVVTAYRERLLSGPYKLRYVAIRRALNERLDAGEMLLPPVF